MSLLDSIHGSYIHTRRVRVLTDLVAQLLPPDCSVLDIGCGDGKLAAGLAAQRQDIRISGADVLVRPTAAIPVRKIDGLQLPWEDNAVDAAMFIDVLHHCEDATALLREAKRVARRAIIIKDHNLSGVLARLRLTFMDRVGNARHGVSLPCNYFTKDEWAEMFRQLSLRVEHISSDFSLYPPPLEWFFGGRLHFIALLRPEDT